MAGHVHPCTAHSGCMCDGPAEQHGTQTPTGAPRAHSGRSDVGSTNGQESMSVCLAADVDVTIVPQLSSPVFQREREREYERERHL